MSEKTVTVIDDASGNKVTVPLYEGTAGDPCFDIRKLNSQLGYFTYDPGFVSTASCRSAITYIDGDNGVLMYRGYPIEQLAEKSSYLECCYLLLHGELPDTDEKADFEKTIKNHTMVHEGIRHFFNGFHYDAHPMAMLVGTVGALSSFYHDSIDVNNAEHRKISAHRLIAKMPTIAANCFKHFRGQPFNYPSNDLGYVENFLHMMFSVPAEAFKPNPIFVKALEIIMILHADHEQNASTSTVRLASSSGANPFASIAAGIASLWGPAHGGANEPVINILNRIVADGGDVGKYVAKAKDKSDPFRLMGFGHRVYKNYDPRAKIIGRICKELLEEIGDDDNQLLDIAMQLEKIALEDDYFVEKKLYPNVDFYSGIMLQAMGIPMNMFTVIFALARTVGWISHWNEQMDDPELRIGRPRQLYVGPAKRDYPG